MRENFEPFCAAALQETRNCYQFHSFLSLTFRARQYGENALRLQTVPVSQLIIFRRHRRILSYSLTRKADWSCAVSISFVQVRSGVPLFPWAYRSYQVALGMLVELKIENCGFSRDSGYEKARRGAWNREWR